METNYIKTILTILEEGSFQKASERLNCSQSTVTFHVQQLENELSVRLFKKAGRKMVLTREGEALLPHMEMVLKETDFLKNYGRDISQLSSTLKVGVPDELFCYGLGPVLSTFRRRAPKLHLVVVPMPCQEIRDGVINHELDLGIHCKIGGYPDSILEEEFSYFYANLVTSAEAEDTDYVSLHQRKPLPLMYSDPGGLHQKRFLTYLADHDIVMNGKMELGSTEAVKVSVEHSMGVAYLPDFVVKEDLQAGRMKKVSTELDDEKIPVICACYKNRLSDPAIELCFEIIRQEPDFVSTAKRERYKIAHPTI